MKKEIGAIAAVPTILLAGCLPRPIEVQETKESAPPTYNSYVSTDKLSEQLPDAVARQLGNVVAFSSHLVTEYGLPVGNKLNLCSGVRIDQYNYLTAGHCDMKVPTDTAGLPVCDEVSIDSSGGSEQGMEMVGDRRTV